MIRTFLLIALAIAGASAAAVDDPPTEWIDPTSGHRVIRLSREPGSASLYFHQNQYTDTGDKLIFTTPTGISTLDVKTRTIEQVVEGRAAGIVVGRKTRQVFYFKGDTLHATHLDTRVTRSIVTRAELRSGSGLAVNADETVLAGSFVVGGRPVEPTTPTTSGQLNLLVPRAQEATLEERWAARRPMALYTVNIGSGAVTTFHNSTDWLNHVQFSPTDPTLLMFCHEGPWHKVDRIWTIRTDGSALRLIHKRTMDMEIAGHEFFSQDGKVIWYDLQTPKFKQFWLAGVVLATGETIRYPLDREHWSVHFNASPDDRLFAGDGGGPNSVAAPGNGQWIYLYTPVNSPNALPRGGPLKVEKLVDLSKHEYRLEPNVSFTPDQKWIVFRSNIHGATHVYAVEVAKAR